MRQVIIICQHFTAACKKAKKEKEHFTLWSKAASMFHESQVHNFVKALPTLDHLCVLTFSLHHCMQCLIYMP